MNQNYTTTEWRPAPEPQRAKMDKVVAKRDYVLQKLVENKAKHDVLYEAAVQTYWKLAKIQVGKIEKNFYKDLADYEKKIKKIFKNRKSQVRDKKDTLSIGLYNFCPNDNLNLSYPENHSQDYELAIEMLKATVYDEIELSLTEFNWYVMNDWTWKTAFLRPFRDYSNNDVINLFACSGSIITGCSPITYTSSYSSGVVSTINSLGSGIVNF